MRTAQPDYQPNHSFSKKVSRDQVILIAIILLELIVFYSLTIHLNYENETTKMILLSVFSVMLALSISTGLWAGLTDPTDQLVKSRLTGSETQQCFEKFRLITYREKQGDNALNFCKECDSFAKKSSYHCKTCKRCSQGFDHHCTFLNVCIGGKNYRQFALTATFTWIHFVIYLISMGIGSSLKNAHSLSGEDLRFTVTMVLGWITGTAVFFALIFLSILLIFHLYLWQKDLTTLGFILKKKQSKKMEELKQKEQKATQQVSQEKIMQMDNSGELIADELKNHTPLNIANSKITRLTSPVKIQTKQQKNDFEKQQASSQDPLRSGQRSHRLSESVASIQEQRFTSNDEAQLAEKKHQRPLKLEQVHQDTRQVDQQSNQNLNKKVAFVPSKQKSSRLQGTKRNKTESDFKKSISNLIMDRSSLGTLLNEDTGSIPMADKEKNKQLENQLSKEKLKGNKLFQQLPQQSNSKRRLQDFSQSQINDMIGRCQQDNKQGSSEHI